MNASVGGGTLAVLNILFGLLSIASIVCWVMVLIKIFKDNVGLGILGLICPLFTFIYGWVKAKEYAVQKVMMVWTILVVVSIILSALGAGAAFTALISEMQGA